MVEPLAHQAAGQGVGDGHDGHPLMMRHVALHHGNAATRQHTVGGKVEGFIEATEPEATHGLQVVVVPPCSTGIQHRGQPGCIGRDHQIPGKSALEPKPRHTEGGILVVEIHIPRVETGFRNAPRDALRPSVGDLSLDDQSTGVTQLTAFGFSHHQPRHQVFEHRAGPGDENGAATGCGDRPPQAEPVAQRQILFGDGEETGQTRL